MEDIIKHILEKGVVAKHKASNKSRDNSHIHPSSIGSCKRKILYDLQGHKGTEPSKRTMRIFQNGHSAHTRLSEYFRLAEVLIEEEKAISYNKLKIPIRGHVDALINVNGEKVLIDFKTVGSYGYRLLMRGEQPKKGYIWQLQLYMFITKIYNSYLIYENKDNQQIHIAHVPYDPSIIDLIIKKVNSLAWWVKQQKRVPKKEVSWLCNYCNHKERCDAQ